MSDSSRNVPAAEGPVRSRAPATMLIFAVSLVLSLLSQTGVLLQDRMLRPDNLTLDSLLVSPLLHLAGAHMILTLFVFLCLGSVLETCWGTPRFVVFYLLVSWGTAAVTVLALSACGRKGPLEPPPSATPVQGEASEGEPAPAEAPPEQRRFFLDFLL